jgi:hypothetical protein
MASRDEADFSVTNEGTVHLYAALTDNAVAFVEAELALEEWQVMGPGMFAIDYSLSFRLTQQLISEGFTVI